MITQTETTACETFYNVDGIEVRLWVITGGQPAIDFIDYGHQYRFPVTLEKYSSENCVGTGRDCIGHVTDFTHYKHQDPKNPHGITYQELPNGEQDILDFIKENLPKKQLRDYRFKSLINGAFYRSKKVLDKESMEYLTARIDFRFCGLSSVHIESASSTGQENKINLFPKWWQEAMTIIEPHKGKAWEELTEEEYQAIKNHLATYQKPKTF